jgi:hypothetical protein
MGNVSNESAEKALQVPTGRYKTFGEFGPLYQVGHPVCQLENGDWLVGITVVLSGERVEYRLSRLKEDPFAA